MILAQHQHGSDVYGPVTPSTAIAPHRGDVTTVRAAAAVRLRAEKRIEKMQTHVASHRTAGTIPLPSAGPAAWRAFAPGLF